MLMYEIRVRHTIESYGDNKEVSRALERLGLEGIRTREKCLIIPKQTLTTFTEEKAFYLQLLLASYDIKSIVFGTTLNNRTIKLKKCTI